MIKRIDQLIGAAKEKETKSLAVACAQDPDVLMAVEAARVNGVADAILVGDKDAIFEVAKKSNIELKNYQVIDVKDSAEASLKAVELVSTGKAHIVMKGQVDTSVVLKAVLNKEVGLRTGNVLSHVAVVDVPDYPRLLLITDAAMNIAPDLIAKKQILENSLVVAKALDIDMPKVGAICSKEKVNPKMQATVDAADLVEMNNRGEIAGCIVGGPFGLDNAISEEAARIKGIVHPAAGKCDILLAPTLDVGNVLYKSLNFLGKAQSAGVIVGAKAPVVLTSRADSDASKLNSIALGVLMASK